MGNSQPGGRGLGEGELGNGTYLHPPPQPSPIKGEGVKGLNLYNINLGRYTRNHFKNIF